MRLSIIAVLLLSSVLQAMAGRNNLKPSDFEPLTSLPWKKPDATIESVLEAIYREPNINIRYPILADYLGMIPVGELGKAFELCIDLEGTQTPDELVAFFLPIWAERDPKRCWHRTKELFRLVGIEDGWLGYDSWKNARITVQDRDAIQRSRFWLRSPALTSFPWGVDNSSLPKDRRVTLMKEFSNVWFAAFACWPYSGGHGFPWTYSGRSLGTHIFEDSVENLRSYTSWTHSVSDEWQFEMALRRWLEQEPGSAAEIIRRSRESKWQPEGRREMHSGGPSTELLVIWAKVDLPAMIRWAESLDFRKDELARTTKGFLMSRVDTATRERWLADAKSENEKDDYTQSLLEGWAAWDPKPGLDAAIATKKPDTIDAVVHSAACGPWDFSVTRFGIDVLKGIDAASLPEEFRKTQFMNWEVMMECWGDIDIGEAARYGLDFLLRTSYAPRETLIKFFGGEDGYTDDAMIDRTFCALRVWAVVRPKEVKAWIGTLKDAEMRKALTWLLEHPWGTGPEE